MTHLGRLPFVVAIGGVLLLSGCSTFIRIAVMAETERLQKLRAWEGSLATQNCDQLDEEYAKLVKIKDDLLDFDQRQGIMRDAMIERNCTLPEDLA
ncbi:MAG: hypothetical protein AAF557_10455 [Pseudomonadota bacterium]